jgi:hypothetical protein
MVRGSPEQVALRFRLASEGKEEPKMQIGYGENGRTLTWQAHFEPETKCVKCGEKARIALIVREPGGMHEYVCDRHPNDPKGERSNDPGFWLHDAAAFAIYLCTDIDCATATTLWNQA